MTGRGEDALLDAADRLYGAPPGDFVRERAALARTARADGDRDLAARIGALAKPSAAAALLNELVRDAPEDVQRVLELGAALREAQQQADRERLQRLTAERRSLLPALAEQAAARAEEDGRRPSAAVLEAFQQTLQATLASEAAGDAVRSGRLVRALDADGVDPVDLRNAVAVPGAAVALTARSRERPEVADLDAARTARERASAEEAAQGARRRAAELRRAADAAGARAAAAEDEARARQDEVAERRAELERARHLLDEAERASQEARSAADTAARAAGSAREDAERADAAADEAQAALQSSDGQKA